MGPTWVYVKLRLVPTTNVAYPLLLLPPPPTCHPFPRPSNSNLRPKPLGGNHTWPPLIHPINLANRLSSPPILKLQTKSPSHHTCSSDEWKHFLAPLPIEKHFLWTPYQLVSFIILSIGDVPSSFIHLHCKCIIQIHPTFERWCRLFPTSKYLQMQLPLNAQAYELPKQLFLHHPPFKCSLQIHHTFEWCDHSKHDLTPNIFKCR